MTERDFSMVVTQREDGLVTIRMGGRAAFCNIGLMTHLQPEELTMLGAVLSREVRLAYHRGAEDKDEEWRDLLYRYNIPVPTDDEEDDCPYDEESDEPDSATLGGVPQAEANGGPDE